MPISAMDGIPASHWQDVKSIITEALLPGWQVGLVSDADDAGVIQLRIVGRLYSDDMVVVDVSARNPNVMFELGMRLAFDKPTVIIKDDLTPIPFDISPTEYITYPRDLRYASIVDFQKRLAAKVEATAKPEHTTYLKSFGPFKVAKIETQEVPFDRLMIDRLDRLESLILRANERREPRILGGMSRWGTSPPSTRKKYLEILSDLKISDEIIDNVSRQALVELGDTPIHSDVERWCIQRGFIQP